MLMGCESQPTSLELITLCDMARHARSGSAQEVLDSFRGRLSDKVAAGLDAALAPVATGTPDEKYEALLGWAHRANPHFTCPELKALWGAAEPAAPDASPSPKK